jgi:RNA polymerase sigma-70 factor (ECF subfamily)
MDQEIQVDPELWVDAYGDYLYRYAYSRLRDANAAEEAVQETFMAGIRYQSQFSGKGSERAWLLGILKRKIIDYIRLQSRYARNGAFDDPDPTLHLFDEHGRWKKGTFQDVSPDSRLQADELQQVVRDCLEHLPPGQAAVFVLSVMEEMDSDHICRELDISPSNLWVRLHRARLSLAKCVGLKWFQEEVPHHVK